MSDNPEHVGWLDLETTGSDETRDYILEIGLYVVTQDRKPIFEAQYCIPDLWRWQPLKVSPAVQQMHTDNKLWYDLYHSPNYSCGEIEGRLIELLKETGVKRMILAGSGVSHFDRRFLQRWMPDLTKFFTYYAWDVGVVRRLFQSTGTIYSTTVVQSKPHRALPDAKMHFAEWCYFQDLIAVLMRPRG